MKNWKTVLVTAVIVLLVVVLALLSVKAFEPQEKRDIIGRTKQYKLLLEEQKLITEILKLKFEAAVIKAKFSPAPQPAPQPVPQPAPLPQVKE